MISIYAGALIMAGLFTLVPGRLMHPVAVRLLKSRKKRAPGRRFFSRFGRPDSPPRRAASTAR